METESGAGVYESNGIVWEGKIDPVAGCDPVSAKRRGGKPRKYRRYVDWLASGLDAIELCLIARAQGMKVVRAWRPGVCATSSLCLFGTAAQMTATEAEWYSYGADRVHRKPGPGAFAIGEGTDDPGEWDEAKADWAAHERTRPLPQRVAETNERMASSWRDRNRYIPVDATLPDDLFLYWSTVKRYADPYQFDASGAWVGMEAYLEHKKEGKKAAPKRAEQEALAAAQRLLSPLSMTASCRRDRSRWTNPGYCPPAPFGNYLWTYTTAVVLNLVWLHPEFIEGFRYGRGRGKRERDANPYQWASGNSWDCGYILGIASPAKLKAWCDALGAR